MIEIKSDIKYLLLLKNKIIFILFIFLFLSFYIKFIFSNYKTKNLKKNYKYKRIFVCICTLGKNENKYIREFINHYKKYGVDKIYLYDNNDLNDEKFEDVISDYIDEGFVEIVNWRGIRKGIHKLMNDCYKNNYEKYHWLIFYEIDEFINLHHYTNIKYFLNKRQFKKCQLIYLNLICHTDNNLLKYENKSLKERFPEVVSNKDISLEVKFIIRGHLKNIKIKHIHTCNKKLINCNGFGHKNKIKYNRITTEPDYNYYYIDHYYSKSTEEFINKLNRGDIFRNDIKYLMKKIRKYFSQSKLTQKKVEMIEKGTGLNLSIYKDKIKSKFYKKL